MGSGPFALVVFAVLSVLVSVLLAGCETAPQQSAAQAGAVAASGARPAPYLEIVRGQPAPAPASATMTFPGIDRYPDAKPNPVHAVAEQPVSTFSADVDTASYAVARRFLRNGRLPPAAAVRVEEMVNYFPYSYAAPEDRARPFQTTATIVQTPWNPDTKLLHIGIKGFDVARTARPRANIVLLVDVSGSMAPADRLPLLQDVFRLFIREMRDDDTVAIVTYAGEARTAVEPTLGKDRAKLIEAVDSLRAYGGTAGGEGLQRAYALAERQFDKSAVNRVILATDGDFNVGITDPKQLESFIADKRKTGIYLSVLGVGLGNLNDALMQRLAQAGNGNAAYIDSLLEGRKVLVDELTANLFTIADDVKIQIEFNPARVAEYRLIGYETRALRREDFANDRVDAGEIGAGHTVTALYEIVPVGSPARLLEPLRYQPEPARPAATDDEYAFVRIRYKLPGETASRLIETPVAAKQDVGSFASAPADLRFASAVAAFGQLLRAERYLKAFSYDDVVQIANAARGADPQGYRAEFVQLVRLAKDLPATARP